MCFGRRCAAMWVGSLLLTASAIANPAEPAPPAVVPNEPAPAPAPRAAGGQIRGGGGVGFAPAHHIDQMEAVRRILGAGDEDWNKISPKIERTLAAKRNTSTGAGMNWTASNNAKPTFKPADTQPDTAPGAAMQEVRVAAADETSTDNDLAAKMQAVRDARQKARAEYEAAQRELIDAVTARQQAVLMMIGVIE